MLPAERNSTPLVRPLLIRCSKRPVDGQAADADAQDQDAHVLDAGVGQHAFEVALPDHEDGGDGHRQQPHEDHDLAGELGIGPGATDLVNPQDGQEGTARDASGQERAHHPRRFAVGVRLPGVHRGQAHLGPIADEEQHEGRVQPGGDRCGASSTSWSKSSVDSSPALSDA